MLVTDYQGPLLSVVSSLIDRGTSSEMNAPSAVQCSGPARAALRWNSPPIAGQANVYARLFHDASAFEAMPSAALGVAGDQHIHQGSACGGCFGGNRKVATGATPYQPLGVVARQQSGFLVDDIPHSQLAAGLLGATLVGQCRCAEINYVLALLPPSRCTSLRRYCFGLFLRGLSLSLALLPRSSFE